MKPALEGTIAQAVLGEEGFHGFWTVEHHERQTN
jgi:hypothetical protein